MPTPHPRPRDETETVVVPSARHEQTEASDPTRWDPSASQALPRRSRPPPLAPSTRIAGRYHVVRAIARGGYGEVYEAHDERMHRAVALKIGSRTTRSAWAIEALRGEFAVLASLHHPNLADVYDFGWLGDAAYFTQRLVPGVCLDETNLELASPRGLGLVAQLCRALDYLHARGVLHRDVKPANILVDLEKDELVLLDFGIASALGASEGASIVGTHAYMPPEAVRGQPLDARSDLYSLGVSLYRMLAGAVPFPAAGRPPAEVLWDHVSKPPPPLPERVPAPVADVVMRLLEKDPAARFASAGEIIDALSSALGLPLARETPDTIASYVLSGSFVQNEASSALAELEASVARAEPWPPVALVGDAGSGKSRTLRELRHRVQLDGVHWVSVQARQGQSVHALVRELAEIVLVPEVTSRLGAEDRIELARGVPTLRRPGERLATPVDPDRARHLRIEALGRGLALRLDGRRGVVVVEDAHAIDGSFGAALADIAHAAAVASARLTFVVSARPCAEIDALIEDGQAQRIECEELSPAATRALVASTFGAEDVLDGSGLGDALATRSQNALWVQESLRLAVETGDVVRRAGRFVRRGAIPARAIEDVLARRVALLPADARDVALAAAVWGGAATVTELARAAGRTLPRTAAGLRELVRAGIVATTRDARDRASYAMHDRYAEILPGLVPGETVRETRSRAARACMRGTADASALARAAHLFAAAGDRDAAREAWQAASTAAERDGRPDLALRLLERARSLSTPTLALELRRHDLARTSGLREVAAQALVALTRLSRRASPSERVEILVRRARDAAGRGEPRVATRLARSAVSLAARTGDRATLLRATMLRGELEAAYGSLETAAREHRSAATLAARAHDRTSEARAWLGISLARVQMGLSHEAHHAAARAADAARASEDLPLRSDAQRQLGNVARELGQNAAARAHYRRAVDAARACGCIEREAKALNNLGTVAQFLGDVDEAMQAFVRSIELKERAGAINSALVGHNNVGGLELALGRREAARASLERVLRAGPSGGAPVCAIATSNLGDLEAMSGALDRAIDRYHEALELCHAHALRTLESHTRVGLARVLAMRAGEGDLEAAEGHARTLGEIVETAETPESERRLACVRAILADVRGDAAQAVKEARRARHVRDRMTRFCDFFCTHVEMRWIEAIVRQRAGDGAGSRRAALAARRALEQDAARLSGAARASYVEDHPIHRAIVRGETTLAPGWTYTPG